MSVSAPVWVFIIAIGVAAVFVLVEVVLGILAWASHRIQQKQREREVAQMVARRRRGGVAS